EHDPKSPLSYETPPPNEIPGWRLALRAAGAVLVPVAFALGACFAAAMASEAVGLGQNTVTVYLVVLAILTPLLAAALWITFRRLRPSRGRRVIGITLLVGACLGLLLMGTCSALFIG